MSVFDRFQSIGLLVLRVVLGVIMLAHGYPKVAGGFHNHAAFVSSLGLPWWMAFLSTGAELVGGALLILGFFTRFAAIAICIEMIVAIWKVHWKYGLLAEHGYQLPLLLAAMAFALIFLGPGAISLDRLRTGGVSRKKKS